MFAATQWDVGSQAGSPACGSCSTVMRVLLGCSPPLLWRASAPAGGCVREVALSGHILVAGNGVDPNALLALLAPLRSQSLGRARCAPVVLLDAAAQPHGPVWADVAGLSGVFIIQASVCDTNALMAANAEQAAVGVLLQPWCTSSPARCAADERAVAPAGLDDARVVAAANTLRSVNPGIQLFVELGQYNSLALMSSTGSLLSWQAGESSRAAASPAFMAGQVLMPAMLDAMVCQTLYNHTTPHIVSQLLSQWHAQLGGQGNPDDPSAADAAQVVAEAAAPGQPAQGDKQLSNGGVQQQPIDSKQLHAATNACAKPQGATNILQHAGGAVLLQVPVAGVAAVPRLARSLAGCWLSGAWWPLRCTARRTTRAPGCSTSTPTPAKCAGS
ncbi:hypothetical protein COO60DRAFT_1532573, partial [Scenedesmus sp. NREL 46B-D3]